MTKRKKTIIVSVAMILLLSTLCTLTYAYYIDRDRIVNMMHVSDSKIEIWEEFPPDNPPIYPPGYTRQKEVKIKNLKDKSYVRCYIEVSNQELVDNNALMLEFSGEPNWVKEGEYWYYTEPLDTGESTPPLLEAVHFFVNVPKGEFDVIVFAESIQAEGFKDYKEAFSHFKK